MAHQNPSHWRRFQRGLFLPAVLALLLRALIPTGFMIASVEGHAQLVLCPAGIHLAGHLHHMAGAVHQPAGPGDVALAGHAAGFAHAADQCPFALAGGPGLTGAAPEPAQPYFILLRPARTAAFASVPAAPPLRHLAARGPPTPV